MKPKFISGNNVLQFESDLDYPIREPVTPRQVSSFTNAKMLRTQTFRDDDSQTIILSWSRMSLADRYALENWLRSVVNWSSTLFEYVDHTGTSRYVQAYGQESFDFPIVNNSYAAGTLELLVYPL